jgi:SAM-dependent methyltransferase
VTGHPFGESYAHEYDAFYAEKDYEEECDRIEQLFRTHQPSPIRSILDLGCGTGGHAYPLAARGYQVTGVDRAPGMLAEAERKRGPGDRGPSPIFLLGDIGGLALGRQFDAVLMMFAVLGYQSAEGDFDRAMQTVRSHLVPGGLFIGDIWYGPTVVRVAPSDRIKQIDHAGSIVTRAATTRLDLARHLASVHYRLTHDDIQGGARLAEETHPVRFYFPRELETGFAAAGLELLSLQPFLDLDATLDSQTWNAIFCARLVAS